MGGEESDGFQGLSAGLTGWQERRQGLEVEGLLNRLNPGRGIRLQVLAQAEPDWLPEKQSQDGGWGADIFFKGEPGDGEDLFQPRIAGSQPCQVAPGRENGAGGIHRFRGAGEIHGLGEQGETEAGTQMLRVEKGGRQFRERGGAAARCQQDFFLQRMEADGQEEAGRHRDGAGEKQKPGRGFQE